jgi:glycosyltransferase involved in cell wall biosynthesis
MNVLVSAYACNPLATEDSYPGEAILGWNLVRQLSRRHRLWVITRAYNLEAIERAQKNGEADHVVFHYLSLPKAFSGLLRNFFGFRVYYLFWQIQAYRVARRLHGKVGFDVFHQITFNNDWMPSFTGALLPIPFLWGPVGGGQRVPPGLLKEMSFKNRALERARMLGQWFWRHSYFRNRGVRKAAAILVCNQETKVKLLPYSRRIFFFPVNGISPDDFCQESVAVPHPEGRFRILFAGRLDPIKGLGLGLRAFEIFKEKFPQTVLEIVGSGPEEIPLRKFVAARGMQSNVCFMPWLPRLELIRKMEQCDIFLFPSLRDGGGAVVVEAMSAGKPVIGLDSGGPGFHIRPEWGLKILPRNPGQVVRDLAGALEKLCLDEGLRSRLGRAARERAREFYVWDRLGQRLFDIYEAALHPGLDDSRL